LYFRRLRKALLCQLFVDLLQARRVSIEAGQQLAPGAALAGRGVFRRELSRVGLELVEGQRRATALEVVVCVRGRVGGRWWK
jgi:hypothetical protein